MIYSITVIYCIHMCYAYAGDFSCMFRGTLRETLCDEVDLFGRLGCQEQVTVLRMLFVAPQDGMDPPMCVFLGAPWS